jgi:hypothetical protein
MGLPFTGPQSIGPEDLDRYAAQLRRIELSVKRQAWFLEASGAIALLIGAQYAATTYSPATGNDGLLVFFSVIAIWLGIGGIAGSIGEVIFGTRRPLRLVFGAALIGLAIAFSFTGTWTEILGPVCTIVALIGGNAMLFRQIVQRRKTKGLAQRLRNDILKGTLWRFEREFHGAAGDPGIERHTVDVFPESKIAAKVNNTILDQPSLVTVTEVAAGGTGGIDAPLAGYEPSTEHFDFRQRHLTSGEKEELSSLLKRDLRKLLIGAAALLWAATVTANGLDRLVTKQPTHLTGRSVVIALAFVFAFLGKHLTALRRIRADLLGGIVIVLRPKEQGTEEITFERLPHSNVAWSEFGAPARWRM